MSDDEPISDSASDSEDDEYAPIAAKPKKPVKFNYDDDEDDDSDASEHLDDKNEDDSNDDESERNSDMDDDMDDAENNEVQKQLRNAIGNGSEDEEDEYFRKFDENLKSDIISKYHPEMLQHNYEEIESLTTLTYKDGLIDDPIHRTLPFLTKYERARVLGERAKQLNSGAKPFVNVDESVIDGYLIAMKELEEKKIPFIIRRPLPNGASEYWKLKDLEILFA